ETCHLGQLRAALEQEPDGRQVVWLVQRRERNEFRKVLQHRVVDAHRRGVVLPAVNDAVSDAREWRIAELGTQVFDDVLERAIVAELPAIVPGAAGEGSA